MRLHPFPIVLALAMCVGNTLPAYALQDTEDPMLSPLSTEPHGAMVLGDGLPSVPELVRAHGLESEGSVELKAWEDSWNLRDGEGALVRTTQVYPGLAARLFPLLKHAGVAELLRENEESLRSAKRVEVVLADRQVESALELALLHHQQAVVALDVGDGEQALRRALQSADALREVSPEQVASGLLLQAQNGLRRNHALKTYPREKLARIRRLTSGAAEALEDGDYPRAIRRAYYACQLLGVDPG